MADTKKHQIFDDITIGFKGRTFTIPANRVMGAIRVCEKHVTFFELANPERVQLGAISAGFAAILQYAGAGDVQPEEVYEEILAGGEDCTFDAETATAALSALLAMMTPPKRMREKERMREAAKEAEKKIEASSDQGQMSDMNASPTPVLAPSAGV